MTTNTQIPYNDLVGNGTTVRYGYTFGIVENVDLIVLTQVTGGSLVLQIEYSDYTLENLTDIGGDVLFTTAPADGIRVLILRRTTMTQNVDYEEGEPFQAETHEWNLDKITYILQELIGGAWGGLDGDGNPIYITFDLDAVQNAYTVTITNTGGTDAEIPAWVDATLAGVFHGEIMDEGDVPDDESVTTEPNGHMFIGI
jgi:hypothetical protein